jgi:hypothetical protein
MFLLLVLKMYIYFGQFRPSSNIFIELVNCFVCDTKPSHFLTYTIIIYYQELTPKTYEMNIYKEL